jgi:hypothetical protein
VFYLGVKTMSQTQQLASPEQQAPLEHMRADIGEVVPAELQEIPQWITWEAGGYDDKGHLKKFQKGRDGTGNEWEESHQWFSFEDAIADAQKNHRSGVGVVLPAKLSDGNYLVALDFDGVDISSQESNPRYDEIQQTYEDLNQPYAEESPSRKGLRMFIRTTQPVPQVSRVNPFGGKDELFCASGRWVTVTGMQVGGSGIPEETDRLIQLAQSWGAKKVLPPKSPTSSLSPQADHFQSKYARLTESSLIAVLSKIDCFDEPKWHDVSNALARAYGEEGRIYFEGSTQELRDSTDPILVNFIEGRSGESE